MLRNDWKFDYTANKLAEAAAEKMSHHRERLDWWRNKKDEVMASIRSEGIEIDEKIVLSSYQSPKSRDWDRGAQVKVRNDLRNDLDECLDKLQYHTQKLAEYDGWNQVLLANPENRVALDIDDWLFFFSKTN
jgi:hypothetical protein